MCPAFLQRLPRRSLLRRRAFGATRGSRSFARAPVRRARFSTTSLACRRCSDLIHSRSRSRSRRMRREARCVHRGVCRGSSRVHGLRTISSEEAAVGSNCNEERSFRGWRLRRPWPQYTGEYCTGCCMSCCIVCTMFHGGRASLSFILVQRLRLDALNLGPAGHNHTVYHSTLYGIACQFD